MANPRTWRDLRVGVIAVFAIVGAAAATLVYGRVGSLHGNTFRLFATVSDARGVIRGTEVVLDGQRVGLVSEIGFAPPSANRQGLVMRLEILESVHSHIRVDSRADVRRAGSLISSPVLYLRSGTPHARPVNDGDTLAAVSATDLDAAASRARLAARDLPAILSNMRTIAADMRTTDDAVAALRAESADRMHAVTRRISRLANADSTLGRRVHPIVGAAKAAAARVAEARARTDSIRTLLASDRGSIGRFRRDSTLQYRIAASRAELDSLRVLVLGGGGLLGRVRRDSALVAAIHDARRQLDSLWSDMHKRPSRYLVF
jgi:ABC-type transporter Mla subunit MlaD